MNISYKLEQVERIHTQATLSSTTKSNNPNHKTTILCALLMYASEGAVKYGLLRAVCGGVRRVSVCCTPWSSVFAVGACARDACSLAGMCVRVCACERMRLRVRVCVRVLACVVCACVYCVCMCSHARVGACARACVCVCACVLRLCARVLVARGLCCAPWAHVCHGDCVRGACLRACACTCTCMCACVRVSGSPVRSQMCECVRVRKCACMRVCVHARVPACG